MRMPVMGALAASSLLLVAASCGSGTDETRIGDATATIPAPRASATTSSADTDAPTITLDAPLEEALRSPITVSGTSDAAEIVVEATISGEPSPVCARRVTVGAASGQTKSWKASLALVPPEGAARQLTLRAYAYGDEADRGAVERSATLADFTPAIVITSPACGAEETGSVTVSGLSTYFAMPISLDLRDAEGNVVMTSRVITERFSALLRGVEMASWKATLDLGDLRPGLYDVVAYIRNRQDGSHEDEFPVQINVR